MNRTDRPARCAAVHDLSGLGRCSLSVILPAMSVMGVQVCPLPTAVLSTHTGGFGTPARRDLTDYLTEALAHYRTLGLPMECVYTGYLGSVAQVALCQGLFAEWPAAMKVVDPVMGDHGKLYHGFTPELVQGIRELATHADVITPNLTEAALLLGEERNIVTDIAGTTRDSIHTRYNKYGMDFYLVDTAGMRKKGREMEDLEFYSVMRSIRAIENSDVCILMLDAQQGLESQDLNIHNLIVRNRKGCVIVVNKWDLVEKESNTMKEWRAFLAKKLAPFNDIPIVFASALNKQRILEVLQQAIRVYNSRRRRIPTSELNDYILPIIEAYPPASTKGKYIRIKYATQLPTPTPQFAFFVNLPQYIKEPYRRFLENNIRDHWDFAGVPMQIYFRQK